MTAPERRAGRRAARVVGLAVTVGLALGACGIPTDGAPVPLADGAAATTSAAAETSAPADSANSATLYLSGDADTPDLVSVRRGLDGEPTPRRVLEALLAGPTEEDLARGYATLIPSGTRLLNVVVVDRRLTVDLSEEWGELQGPDAFSAYGQVVLSVTELTSVASVRFLVSGELIPAVTTDQGSQDTVTRADFTVLLTE